MSSSHHFSPRSNERERACQRNGKVKRNYQERGSSGEGVDMPMPVGIAAYPFGAQGDTAPWGHLNITSVLGEGSPNSR